jgi:hypothetical protein
VTAIAGYEEVLVEGVGKRIGAYSIEIGWSLWPMLEKILNDELVPISAGHTSIDQALDGIEVGYGCLDVSVQVAQSREEIEGEEVLGAGNQQSLLVTPEHPAKVIVCQPHRVIWIKEGLQGHFHPKHPQATNEEPSKQSD